MVDINVILKFERLTGYPLVKFLADSENFFKQDFRELSNFYKGLTNFIDKQTIVNLNRLAENSIIITNFFFEKKGVMLTVDYWELLDAIEEIKSKLQYAQNISKYLRSSIVSGVNKAGHVFEYALNNQETLEDVTDEVLEEPNPDNRWVQSALDNDLQEKDWDIDGGKRLRLRKRIFQSNLVTSMIDNTIGERIYGRDIKKLMEYKDDDLLILGYRETVFQTVDILGTLKQGDIPEFDNIGIDGELYKGANFSQLNFPSIARELKRSFDTDDLFKDFNIRDIRYEEGDIFIEYEVDTKYEMTVIRNVSL